MKTPVTFTVILYFLTAFSAYSADSPFFGHLEIVSDREGTVLPVYLNGEYKGVTPLKLDTLPVGSYSVSFLSDGLRDSLFKGTATAVNLPNEVQALIEDGVDVKQSSLKTMAEICNQKTVVQHLATTRVILPSSEIEKQFTLFEKKAKKFVIAGSGVLVVFGIFLMVML